MLLTDVKKPLSAAVRLRIPGDQSRSPLSRRRLNHARRERDSSSGSASLPIPSRGHLVALGDA